MVAGHQYNEVIALIQHRVVSGRGYAPERRLGLVVEGGAMRGTYTAGALLALHLAGAAAVFDKAYATSAGAVNAAHFLSGSGHLKAATYYRALNDGRFFRPFRLPRPLNADFLIDEVLRRILPLDVAGLAASPTPLEVAVLHCGLARGEMKRLAAVGEGPWALLRAAVAMPVVYNRRVDLPGGQYVDGGLAIPYPLEQAMSDGMTDIVVLLSRNPEQKARARARWQEMLYAKMFARGRRDLLEVFQNAPALVARLDALALQSPAAAAAGGGPNVLVVAPAECAVRGSTMNGERLRAAMLQMCRETLGLLGNGEAGLDELVRAGVV